MAMKTVLSTMNVNSLRRALLALGLATALAACGGGSDGAGGETIARALPPQATAFTLQVLHVADMDSGGDLVKSSKGLSALVRKFRAEYPDNTVFVSSGDNYIPGPFFNAADDASLTPELGAPGAGRADIEILNVMGLQASALGNHDLDPGTTFFAGLINAGGAWRGAQWPYLSANLDFSTDGSLRALVGQDGAEAESLKNRLAKSAVVTVAGKRIGIVGATTPTLTSITSTGGITVRPADANDIDALAAEIQSAVDALVATGIDKVILLAHMQQIAVEQALATRLRDVDLVVAGGSNTRLFDDDDRIRPGDFSQGTYPLRHVSPTGEPVLVVNVDADYKYLGRIVLHFDGQGRIVTGRLRSDVNGAWASDEEGLARAGLTMADAMPGVVAIADKVGGIIAAKDGNLFGAAGVYLEGDRVFVRNQETNLGHLTAEANLVFAQALDATTAVSLKNGGGIRASIGGIDAPAGSTVGVKSRTKANPAVGKEAGDISQLDIEFALRFNNGLSLLTVTAPELKTLLEHGVAQLGTQGRYPQVAGMRFSYDPAQPAGSRVRTLVVDDPDGAGPGTGPVVVYRGGALQVPATATFRLVTLDFLANGGDGYPFSSLSNAQRVNLIDRASNIDPACGAGFFSCGREQWALADHLRTRYPRAAPYAEADTTPSQDRRIQNLSVRAEQLP
jgi:2',3'-cyclic-nucleotide 2'-phosphodiesterase (5'-nucleotidase family)